MKNKERLEEQTRNKYWELSNEKEDMKKDYGRNRYKNTFEEDKQKLKKHQKTWSKENIIINFFCII